jgi:hypothetical protein
MKDYDDIIAKIMYEYSLKFHLNILFKMSNIIFLHAKVLNLINFD